MNLLLISAVEELQQFLHCKNHTQCERELCGGKMIMTYQWFVHQCKSGVWAKPAELYKWIWEECNTLLINLLIPALCGTRLPTSENVRKGCFGVTLKNSFSPIDFSYFSEDYSKENLIQIYMTSHAHQRPFTSLTYTTTSLKFHSGIPGSCLDVLI